MKKDIHPQVYKDAKVTCVCGNTFTTMSILSEIRVEVCSKCHPFFTGEMKFVDSLGRVERFQKRQQAAKVIAQKREEKIREDKEKPTRPENLRDLFDIAKKQASS